MANEDLDKGLRAIEADPLASEILEVFKQHVNVEPPDPDSGLIIADETRAVLESLSTGYRGLFGAMVIAGMRVEEMHLEDFDSESFEAGILVAYLGLVNLLHATGRSVSVK